MVKTPEKIPPKGRTQFLTFDEVQTLGAGPRSGSSNRGRSPHFRPNVARREPPQKKQRTPMEFQFQPAGVVEKSGTTGTHSKATAPEQIVKDQRSRSQLPQSSPQMEEQSKCPLCGSVVPGTSHADPQWIGDFIFPFDSGKLELYKIQAHPAMLPGGRGNIVQLCRQMPPVVQLNCTPLEDVLSLLEGGIQLYFFPSGERRGYDMLVESKNSALKAQIRSDFELLVFSSKLLPEASQSINNQNYLCGVFNNLKSKAVELE